MSYVKIMVVSCHLLFCFTKLPETRLSSVLLAFLRSQGYLRFAYYRQYHKVIQFFSNREPRFRFNLKADGGICKITGGEYTGFMGRV